MKAKQRRRAQGKTRALRSGADTATGARREPMRLEISTWLSALAEAKEGQVELLGQFLRARVVPPMPLEVREFLADLLTGKATLQRRPGRRGKLGEHARYVIREALRVNDTNYPGDRRGRAELIESLAAIFQVKPNTIRDIVARRPGRYSEK